MMAIVKKKAKAKGAKNCVIKQIPVLNDYKEIAY